MRLKDVPKLRDGSIITCTAGCGSGCDGKKRKVRIEKLLCGCKVYYHEKTPSFFAYGSRRCLYNPGLWWAPEVKGHHIKVVKY